MALDEQLDPRGRARGSPVLLPRRRSPARPPGGRCCAPPRTGASAALLAASASASGRAGTAISSAPQLVQPGSGRRGDRQHASAPTRSPSRRRRPPCSSSGTAGRAWRAGRARAAGPGPRRRRRARRGPSRSVASGSAPQRRVSTRCTSTRQRSTCARNSWPRPAPSGGALDQPRDVGQDELAVVGLDRPEHRLQRRERVVGDLRLRRRSAARAASDLPALGSPTSPASASSFRRSSIQPSSPPQARSRRSAAPGAWSS